jgi:hypothetical protein
MDFDANYDIDYEALHGEGMSLQFINVIGVTNELIHEVGAFNVAKVVIKGVDLGS